MHGRDHLDTYLLRVLHTLLTEQSVTRTAVRLGQSQPAISNTLKRLREITGDAILVRGKNGMVPTERGRELLALAEQSLAAMDRIARPPQQFDPATTTRTFHLARRTTWTPSSCPISSSACAGWRRAPSCSCIR